MRMHFANAVTLGLVALGLCACNPAVPESGAGVGFTDYSSYVKEREAALANGTPVPNGPGGAGIVGPAVSGSVIGAPPLVADTGFSTARLGAAIDAADGGGVVAMPGAGLSTGLPQPPLGQGAVIGATGTAMAAPAPMVPAPATAPAAPAPAAPLPERSSDGGPNIVAFALSTSHAPGTPIYERSSLRLGDVAATCRKYGSSDQAQEAFLAAGGPDKDRKGLDPDGDGYACSWDPTPFRAALN